MQGFLKAWLASNEFEAVPAKPPFGGYFSRRRPASLLQGRFQPCRTHLQMENENSLRHYVKNALPV